MESEIASKLLSQRQQLRMAHDAVMIEDAQQLLKQNRATISGHHEKLGGMDPTAGDDGVIHIGDTVINQQPQPPKQGASALAKLGLAAALLGTGVGAGAAIPLAIDALSAAKAPAMVDTDTDTNTLFDLVIPEKK